MNISTKTRTIRDLIVRTLRTLLVLVAIIVGTAGVVASAPATSGLAAPALGGYGVDTEGVQFEPFIRTELFFGSERRGKPEVSDVEFKQFLDEQITPRFPDGLTVTKGFGQFREANGTIVQESSFVVILLYPVEVCQESSTKIEEIRTLYKERFEQESVLRTDDPLPVRVSF